MIRVPCNTRSQRDSQHREVTPRTNISRTQCCFTTPPVDHRWVGLIGCLAKPSKANSTPCWLSLSLSFSQKSTCTKVTHLDDGVPDSISSLMVSSRDHTPKTFPCAFMHIHLFRSSLLKIGDTRPWVYDTRTCNHFEHENQSNLSGIVLNGSKEALRPLLPLRHGS
jgi:hypothetical protein